MWIAQNTHLLEYSAVHDEVQAADALQGYVNLLLKQNPKHLGLLSYCLRSAAAFWNSLYAFDVPNPGSAALAMLLAACCMVSRAVFNGDSKGQTGMFLVQHYLLLLTLWRRLCA